MSQITKNVDKTTVIDSESFTYTIDATFSDLASPANNGQIIDFFPSKIDYILPPVGGGIVSIDEVPASGGTEVQFNLGPINSATVVNFQITCSFGRGRVDNDSFTNSALSYADGVFVTEGSAPEVTLTLNSDFSLVKSVEPTALVNAGDELTFTLALISNNFGGAVNNVIISDLLPPQLIPVTSYDPVGNDNSEIGYEDHSADDLIGTWTGSTMSFDLPSYHGTRYEITFKATVSNSVSPGDTFQNIAQWSIDSVVQPDTTPVEIKIFNPATDFFTVAKVAPRTTIADVPIFYTLSTRNQTPTTLFNYVLEDPLPTQMDCYAFKLSRGLSLVDYSIQISLDSDPTNFITVATADQTDLPLTYLTSYIPAGDRVNTVKLIADSINPGQYPHYLYLYCVTNPTAVIGETILNGVTATSGLITGYAQSLTTVEASSDLDISEAISPSAPGYPPLEEFTIILSAVGFNTMTVNPVIMDLLPIGLRYVDNSEYFLYDEIMTGIQYDSRKPGFPVPTPTREVINNFDGSGQTLLRWSFDDFVLPYKEEYSVAFKAFAEIGAANPLINYAYEGVPGNDHQFVTNPVTDTSDMDNDGLTDTDSLSEATLNIPILSSTDFMLKKLVKGENDLDFSDSGSTVVGGNIYYQLQITNDQLDLLRDIEIVDILPYVGDTDVLLNTQPRGSEFTAYATSSVSTELINLLGDPVDPNPDIIIEYSTSNDPMRFDNNGNPIGTGNWFATPPADITELRSFRVTTGPSFTLNPNERLTISISAKAPIDAGIGWDAYNSYAIRGIRISGGIIEPMLPIEPAKVEMNATANTLGVIGNFVWEDLDKNGLYDPGEPGMNGITVELYSDLGVLRNSTVTSNNIYGEPGYYSFADLPDGNYQIKFLPYSPYLLTQQNTTDPNGSKPDPATGFTDIITITGGALVSNVIAGVYEDFGVIGSFVWEDINKNGIYDPGEVGMNGISVELYSGAGVLLDTTVTADNENGEPGYYLFSGLIDGDYQVKFLPVYPDILTQQNTIDPNGSSPDPATGFTDIITILNRQKILDINAGIYEDFGAIGSFVWEDLNRNGLYDPNETGVNGITVELYSDTGTFIDSTVTADNASGEPGYYLFSDLPDGDYQVKFITSGYYILTQQNTIDPNGSRPDPLTGFTEIITILNRQKVLDINAGIYEDLGAIGNFVWNDLNENGLFDPGEPGMNGVTVELYSETGILLDSTITADDENGEPGYYMFYGLVDGIYQVKFITPINHILTQQRSSEPNGSKPDPTTGLTDFITIANKQFVLDIIAGVLTCSPPVINASDKCIHVGSTFDPVENVSAVDCKGNDITGDIIITANNVNTEEVGIYSVTYEVSDMYGQTTEITISVRVCFQNPCRQAITDLIESAALEQAALSHILNAEGEKIQKAIELDLTNEELLSINNSVSKTIQSITRLDLIIQGKLGLFGDEVCKGDCCNEG